MRLVCGQNGRKILDTARGDLFSSCCELAWPIRPSGKSSSGGGGSYGGSNEEPAGIEKGGSRESMLCRTASRSLPSSPASPRRHQQLQSPRSVQSPLAQEPPMEPKDVTSKVSAIRLAARCLRFERRFHQRNVLPVTLCRSMKKKKTHPPTTSIPCLLYRHRPLFNRPWLILSLRIV